jgi:hypothetical protein
MSARQTATCKKKKKKIKKKEIKNYGKEND